MDSIYYTLQKKGKGMKGSIIIILFFTAGLLAGINDLSPEILKENDASVYALFLLMFLVGIGIGADRNIWPMLKNMNLKILLIPLSVIIGTLAGSGICSLFLKDLNLADTLAVGSGFGYYSLSSIIISQVRNETIGVIALLSNISREIFTLIAAPLLVKYFGKLAPIASGGAASMDTTLPIISRYSGKEYAILSVFSGVVLTLLVPFLIAFIYNVM